MTREMRCSFQFYGVFPFKFQLSDFSELLPSRELEDSEITVSAEVGDMIWNILQGGFSKTRLLDSKLRLKFLGNSPHILRPAMPFKFYVSFRISLFYLLVCRQKQRPHYLNKIFLLRLTISMT